MPSGQIGRRQFVHALGLGAIGVGIAGCVGGGASDPRRIGMTNDLAYDPVDVAVDVGSTVTWRNTSDIGHTVTAYADRIPEDAEYFASGGFQSESAARTDMSEGLLAAGETYAHRFAVPGSYEYYCVPHEAAGMTGTVRVG